jgi:hypothetical protein
MQRSAGARSAALDVQRHLIAKRHWLEIALWTVQLLALVPTRTRTIGRVITDCVTNL